MGKKRRFVPEEINIEGMSQRELKKMGAEMKKQLENTVTYYPEEYDESKGIYSHPLVFNEQEKGK